MKTERIEITYQVAELPSLLDSRDQELLEKAKEAQVNAYAPYSKFQVGAALRRTDGTIVLGNNQENAAYPSGLCAERVALFAASSVEPDGVIDTIAIVAPSGDFDPAAPCGSCRQVLMEYQAKQGRPIRVILHGDRPEVVIFSDVNQLLPFSFTRQQLKYR